ncbi:MAG: hypothetical protein UHI81_09060 [Olegusella sp.]|nr:hypothetical protein [Olegusella sp.]
MTKSVLVADTTREERERIVWRAIGSSMDGACDCCMGMAGVDALYRPYIEGEMELSEINARSAHANARDAHNIPRRGECGER